MAVIAMALVSVSGAFANRMTTVNGGEPEDTTAVCAQKCAVADTVATDSVR